MRLMSEFGTDEAYADAVRRWLANPKQYWSRHIGVFFLLSVTALVVPLLVAEGYEYAVDAKANPGSVVVLVLSQYAGWMFFFVGFCVFFGVRALRGLRMDRLMVTYYDELKGRCGVVEETGYSPFDGWVGLADGSFKARFIRWSYRKDHALKARTDEECVRRARKFLRPPRWVRPSFFVGAAFSAILALGFLRLADRAAGIQGTMPWDAVVTGLISGLLVGLLTLRALFGGFVEAHLSLRSPRVGRLMVRYHDALRGNVQGGAG